MAEDYRAMARAAAARHGVPPALFERQIEQESGFDPKAYNAGSEASGLAQIVPAAHPNVDPWDPAAALDYAATWMATLYQQFGSWRGALAAYNWGPGNLTRNGLGNAPAETRRYLTRILGEGWPEPATEGATMAYAPDTSPERQQQPWTCSVRTATWLLKSIGGTLDAGTVQDRMLAAGLVTPALGLLHGDGSRLAPWLADASGLLTGHQWIDWAWLTAHAGTKPIGMGSPTLYHWVGVRRLNADGTVALMNPAPGWQGVGDTLTEAEFEQWAPWAAVWIETAPAESGEPELSQEERDELTNLRNYVGGLTADVLRPGLAAIEAAAEGQTGKRWTTVRSQVEAIRQGSGVTRE